MSHLRVGMVTQSDCFYSNKILCPRAPSTRYKRVRSLSTSNSFEPETKRAPDDSLRHTWEDQEVFDFMRRCADRAADWHHSTARAVISRYCDVIGRAICADVFKSMIVIGWRERMCFVHHENVTCTVYDNKKCGARISFKAKINILT